MASKSLDVEAIFRVARKIQPADVRAEYLEQACDGDLETLERVQALLSVHDNEPSFLESPAANLGATADYPPITERPGSEIGPYKLVEEIGSGGMGVVYMALQREPVRRKVALKIIKPGMDTREVIGRFKAEEQALAMMDHPNIAKVHDAGATESGRPYFVMELVNGVPITEYCDDNKLATRQRLELFVSVCNAVQHAHQKGVIHRDIKPSNILVTLHDGVPVPKIIDFGIAKAIHQELAASTVVTGFGQMVGTPMYMSPEQAERSGLDVDTRSDIYSLGVLLYELLTGTTPFGKEQLIEAGFDEMRRLIREQDPERPSTRISTLGKAATTMSEHRSTSPAELSNTLRQELDWIAMKALDKDRTQRYETAADLVRDIQRYLNDEPVEACPPSTLYRLRKLARRNRVAVLTTSAVALALILGAAVAAGQAYRATKAEQLAKTQQGLAEEAAARERDLRTEAEAARKQAEQVTKFLTEIFRSPHPARDGRTITVAEMLDKAKTRVETEFQDDDLLQARLLGAIGETYRGLGLYGEAVDLSKKSYDLLREALGAAHPNALAAMKSLADGYWTLDQPDRSIPLFEELLNLARSEFGDDHWWTLWVMGDLGSNYFNDGQWDKAVETLEEALALCEAKFGPKHRITVSTRSKLANVYRPDRLEDALQLQEEALEQHRTLGPDHITTIFVMGQLAEMYGDAGQVDKALSLHEQAHELYKTKLGPDHPDTARSLGRVAETYHAAGDYQKAVELHEQATELQKKNLGPDSPRTLDLMDHLARSLGFAGKYQRAIELHLQTLERWKAVRGPEHRDTLFSMNNLASTYGSAGRYKDAVELHELILEIRQEHLGLEHRDTLSSMANLACAYNRVARYEEAVELNKRTLQLGRKTLGRESPLTLTSMNNLAVVYYFMGRFDEAVPLWEETLQLQTTVLGPKHHSTLRTVNNLGAAYCGTDHCLKAITLLQEALQVQRGKFGEEHPSTLQCKENLADCYRLSGQLDEALPLMVQVVQVKKETLGFDHPKTLSSMGSLAQVYQDMGRLDEAQFLLETTLRMQAEKLGPEHPDTLELGDGLAGVYQSQNQLVAALPLLQDTLRLRREKLGPKHPDTLKSMAGLASVLRDVGELVQAHERYLEALKGLEEVLGPDHSQTIDCITHFAQLHLQQSDFENAERQLLRAEQAISKRQPPTPRDNERMQTILTNLVKLFETTNQPEKAADWREKLEATQAPTKKEETVTQ